MSKSYKKSKVYGIFGDSDKEDKVKAHKKFRRKSKIKLKLNQQLPIHLKEIADIWEFNSEGDKIYDKDINPKFLRK